MKINFKSKAVLKIVLPLVIALFSMIVLSRVASSPNTYQKTIISLDAKKETVTALTAAATTASAAITMIPGDAVTPLADELAELGSGFLIVLSAIYLEKYLLTLTGFVTFKILVPVACVLFAVNSFYDNAALRNMIRKLIITGAVLLCVVPASEKVSGLIQNTYESSIQETISMASQEVTLTEDEEGGLSAIWSKVKDGVSLTTDAIKNLLTNFIEALAVMIVTSCIIPILVLLFFIWFIKFMLGVNINLPKTEDLMIVKKGIHRLKDKTEKKSLTE